jgi:CheY-like chemotaxis protein
MSKKSSLQFLVVEDNTNSRDLLCEMLSLLGHEAQAATTAEEGIELLKSRRFDVLFADINLPAMSGIELARTATTMIPDVKIIFASGFGFLVTDRTDFDFVLLPKPYNLAQLTHAIDNACETGKRSPLKPATCYARTAFDYFSLNINKQRYGKQKWTLKQIKAELLYKTTWGASVVADLVADIERLESILDENAGSDTVAPETER